jgi:hypothetical protein
MLKVEHITYTLIVWEKNQVHLVKSVDVEVDVQREGVREVGDVLAVDGRQVAHLGHS